MKAGSTAQNVDKRHVGGQRMCLLTSRGGILIAFQFQAITDLETSTANIVSESDNSSHILLSRAVASPARSPLTYPSVVETLH